MMFLISIIFVLIKQLTNHFKSCSNELNTLWLLLLGHLVIVYLFTQPLHHKQGVWHKVSFEAE